MENSLVLPNIRIKKITLTNFRNIIHSEVDLPGGKVSDFANGDSAILGIYGQNGSGKTSLIMAIHALKQALSGLEFLYSDFASCIREGCSNARLEFELSAIDGKGTNYSIYYAFSISIEDNSGIRPRKRVEINKITEEFFGQSDLFSEEASNLVYNMGRPADKRIVISDEVLQFSAVNTAGKKTSKQVLIDTTDKACKISGKAFGNKAKYAELTANCENDIAEYLYKAKIEASIYSKSFIFSENVIGKLIEGSEKMSYKIILSSLYEYGNNYLFVVLMDQLSFNSAFKVIPLNIWMNLGDGESTGFMLPIPLFEHCKIAEDYYPYIQESIESIDLVISRIVPGLRLSIHDIGKTLSKNGAEIHMFELISIRNGVSVPLAFESDGIRRIVSFLALLVAVYNDPSVTVAVDEIDSGIFEYMLGELLSIMKDSAKGQLIFTSHNLRPLEVLPYKNLLFTTVNPDKRFSKLEGISGNNNLRDSYFRTITLGSGKNAYYDATDTYNIEQAFYQAGLPKEQ